MTIVQSIVLGLVEGLTEYLPVSSTGHLIITQYLLGLPESDAMKAFEICIQGGAILAVTGLYFKRLLRMTKGLLGKDEAGRRMFFNMLIGFLPAMVLGLLLNDFIKSYLFNAPTVTITWALGGLVILLYSYTKKRKGEEEGKGLEELTWRGALGIGFMQSLAMIPGTSRSLMTMLGGLLVGLSVSAAVEFSFLLGLITLGAATAHDALKYGSTMVSEIGWGPIIVGTVMAWGSAVAAVKWMVRYLQKHSLSVFGWYRIGAAAVMLGFILDGLEVTADSPEHPAEPALVSTPTPEH